MAVLSLISAIETGVECCDNTGKEHTAKIQYASNDLIIEFSFLEYNIIKNNSTRPSNGCTVFLSANQWPPPGHRVSDIQGL